MHNKENKDPQKKKPIKTVTWADKQDNNLNKTPSTTPMADKQDNNLNKTPSTTPKLPSACDNLIERYPFFKQTLLFQSINKFSFLIDANLSTKNS